MTMESIRKNDLGMNKKPESFFLSYKVSRRAICQQKFLTLIFNVVYL